MSALGRDLSTPGANWTAGDDDNKPRKGWHFYEDLQPVPSPARLPASPSNPARPELAQFKALQKAVEEARIVAIMRPTVINVRHYMELEASIIRQSSRFADVAQRVAWISPALDPAAQGRPTNTYAIEVFDREQSKQRADYLSTLSRDHVLMFFYRGDCPYCHAFAPVLKGFEARFGLHVEAISIDGGSLPEFPRPRLDNGISTTLNVKQVPALFLAQPFSGRIVPVGFGVLSQAELVERVYLTATNAQDDAAAALPAALPLR
ncbi:thioredoxin family protein [Duganella sp. FT92W]|uniref:Thioredoxin family protein n=2 Tax=Pseudoduganella rivuli TaxID=2666085 RepID=A0A7X2IIN6_9BURK|nr:conjugal transfer protein TraF [Pseudoduganella rivuli]MRV70584.1 thioredoxin family protein [Pseudoduganella rivuli]